METNNLWKPYSEQDLPVYQRDLLQSDITSGQMNISAILQTILILLTEAGNIENMSENDFLKIISPKQSNKSKTKGAAEC